MQDAKVKVRLGDGTMAQGRVSSIGDKFSIVVLTVHGSEFAVTYANATVKRAVENGSRLQAGEHH